MKRLLVAFFLSSGCGGDPAPEASSPPPPVTESPPQPGTPSEDPVPVLEEPAPVAVKPRDSVAEQRFSNGLGDTRVAGGC